MMRQSSRRWLLSGYVFSRCKIAAWRAACITVGIDHRRPEEMRFLSRRYRDQPRCLLRRADRIAGEVNAVLIVIAIGLAMLDLLYVAQIMVDSLPPAALRASLPHP